MGFGSVTGSVNYSPNFYADSGDAYYYLLATSIPLPESFQVYGLKPIFIGEIGRQYVKDNTAFTTPDYTQWNAGIAVPVFGFDFKLQYQDTSLSDRECSNSNNCGARVLFSISKTF